MLKVMDLIDGFNPLEINNNFKLIYYLLFIIKKIYNFE